MNGGEAGLSPLDRLMLVALGVGLLLIYAGRHLWGT